MPYSPEAKMAANKCVFFAWVCHEVSVGQQRFHLEGNFLPEGNLGLWKEIWKEIAFGKKLGGNIVIRREMRRKSIFSHNF
jgi:hypothetical protein